MAMYIALKIIQGRFDYAVIFGPDVYRDFQEEVDTILIGEGREDLIKK